MCSSNQDGDDAFLTMVADPRWAEAVSEKKKQSSPRDSIVITERTIPKRSRLSSDSATIANPLFRLVIVFVTLTKTIPIIPTTNALLTTLYPSSSSVQITPCQQHFGHVRTQQKTMTLWRSRPQHHIYLPPNLSNQLYSASSSPSTTHSPNDDDVENANSLPRNKWKQKLQHLKRRKIQSVSLSKRIIGDLFYGLTSPFPDLRNILRTRSREDASKSDNSADRQRMVVISLPLRGALIAIISYLSVGVLAYHVLFEKWSIVDSLYFSCVCFSTVGKRYVLCFLDDHSTVMALYGCQATPHLKGSAKNLNVLSLLPSTLHFDKSKRIW
jgi:hypothetical protein